MRTDGEREEKEAKLITRTRACLGKPEKDRSCRISLVTIEEEEDAVIAILDAGSIASSGSFLVAGRSSWARLLGLMLTMAMGRRRGGCGAVRVTYKTEENQGEREKRGFCGGGARMGDEGVGFPGDPRRQR
jgi:hypothetical protein